MAHVFVEEALEANVLKYRTGGDLAGVSVREAAAACVREVPTWLSDILDVLADAPYASAKWELPPLDPAADRPFEFVLIDCPALERPPDPSPFAEHLAAGGPHAVFDNLRGDATLVVPTDREGGSPYTHLLSYVRAAPRGDATGLLRGSFAALWQRSRVQKRWLSTAGLGVPWLHVRIDSRPKYYGWPEYRRM